MSPKRPARPKSPSTETPPTTRETNPDISLTPRMQTDLSNADPTVAQSSGHTSPVPDWRPPSVEIIDLPADTQIRHTSGQRPIGSYFLAPGLVNRLPQPDPYTGLRSAGRYTYVDLIDGGTVLIGNDERNPYRARLPSELQPSGPFLERIESTLFWRPVSAGGADPSQLIVTRRPLPDNAMQAFSDPWKAWGINSQHASVDDIQVDGIRYKVVPRGIASEPIVYVKNPAHMVYDYSLLDHTLRTDLLQQPRGAIRVPPANRWEIDPTLPFQSPLPEYIATYFPELTTTAQRNVAFHQFLLANGSEIATGSGLTLLRQTFNDWKVGNPLPRPQLADPLLMLPILPSSGAGIVRITELPSAVMDGSLQRLDFDPMLFREQWHYFQTTQTAVELKRFMAALLTRNGYTVFEPSLSNSFPALVFERTGHDFVYFMSLHRIRGRKINQTLNVDTHSSSLRLHIQVGPQATQAVLQAHADNRIIWLRGGAQLLSSAADTVFIIRDSHSML